jgi:hypothetical protein
MTRRRCCVEAVAACSWLLVAACGATPAAEPPPRAGANGATQAPTPDAQRVQEHRAKLAVEPSELSGAWISDWGDLTISGYSGTYTATYGTGPGTIAFTKVGDHTYDAVWGESKMRHGTLTVTLTDDGRRLRGKWRPDADVTIGGSEGGPIDWVKKP